LVHLYISQTPTPDQSNAEQAFFDQTGLNMDMQQMIADSIPQLQAQIAQISLMLQNASLPAQVRQQTEIQHQQLHMQLQQAQVVAAALAAASTFQQQQEQQQQMQDVAAANMVFGNFSQGGGAWTNPYSTQQPPSQDSAYQRLPLNNRRRNLKRDRPSDFVEVGSEGDSKVPRYWE
jgi:protein MPE1